MLLCTSLELRRITHNYCNGISLKIISTRKFKPISMASYDLTDVAPSPDASSIVCIANGDETEIAYVITSSLTHLINNAKNVTAYANQLCGIQYNA